MSVSVCDALVSNLICLISGCIFVYIYLFVFVLLWNHTQIILKSRFSVRGFAECAHLLHMCLSKLACLWQRIEIHPQSCASLLCLLALFLLSFLCHLCSVPWFDVFISLGLSDDFEVYLQSINHIQMFYLSFTLSHMHPVNYENNCSPKKIKILSLFAHPHVVPN